MHVAVLTEAALNGYAPDDAPLIEALTRAGAAPRPVVWNAVTPEALAGFDGVLMRSPWDWQHHRAAFRRFLDQLAALPVPVLNAPALLRRFADKVYFRELWSAGVATVPTQFLQPASLAAELPAALERCGWDELVLKPSFTANATGALRLRRDSHAVEKALRHAAAVDAQGEWMLQPFLSQVQSRGEQSLVFIDGAYSHAVLKRPKAGDFRVQAEYGGAATPFVPDLAVRRDAEAAVQRAVPDAVYARVDGVLHDGRFVVMELEVVEPELFLRSAPAAAERLAAAILAGFAQWKRKSVPPS